MATIINPIPLPHYNFRPYNQITPFTYRDGLTYIDVLESLRSYIRDVLVPHINSELTEFGDGYEKNIILLTEYLTDSISQNQSWTQDEINSLAAEVESAVTAVLNSTIEITAPVIQGATNTVNIVNFGADDTGIENITPAWNAAITAVADGGTVIIPAGTYLVTSPLTNHGKSINVVAHGAKLLSGNSSRIFNFSGTYSDMSSVDSIVEIGSSAGDRTFVTRLNFVNELGWRIGDIVKIFADNPIEEGRPEVSGNVGRVGQFAVVSDVTAGYVEVRGKLRDNYTTNPRVAKLDGKTCTITGGTYSRTDETFDTIAPGIMIFLADMALPIVDNIRIYRGTGIGIQFTSCFGYRFNNSEIDTLKDNPGIGIFAYGVTDVSSAHGLTDNCRFMRVRHGYTDGSNAILAGTAPPTQYGRTYGATVSNSSADGAYSTAFDTHASSEAVSFLNVIANNSGGGVALRGKGHKVDGALINDCWTGLNVFDEAVGTSSYGHTINDVEINGKSIVPLTVNRRVAGHPLAGQKDDRLSLKAKNVVINDVVNASPITLRNAVAELDITLNVIDLAGSQPGIVELTNSDIVGGRFIVNGPEVVRTGIRPFKMISGDCQIDTEKYHTNIPVQHQFLISGTNNLPHKVKDVYAPAGFSVATSTSTVAGTVIEWSSDFGSSAILEITGSNLNNAGHMSTLMREKTKDLVAMVSVDATGNVATLAPGRAAQVLNIVNLSTVAITMRHGAEYGTNLVGGANKSIEPSGRMSLVYTGTVWQEI